MRARPVRPNIYLPVVRFGVADSDWLSALLISCASYLAPVPFGITVLYVPLQMWTWLAATAGSIPFFNYIRIGRRPYWLPHKLKSIWLHHRQHPALPNVKKRAFRGSWLVDSAEEKVGDQSQKPQQSLSTSRPYVVLVMDHNYRVQEASNEKWNQLWLTTNLPSIKSHVNAVQCFADRPDEGATHP